MICVGEFFGESDEELTDYKSGAKTVPLPTYFLGPTKESTTKFYDEEWENDEICSNLIYLGKRGLYNLSSGVKVAYLCGNERSKDNSDPEITFTKDDVMSVKNSCIVSKGSMSDYRGIDILVTSQWPEGVQERENCSKLISYLSKEVRPRYHICGFSETYLEPSPYRLSAGDETGFELTTRFLAIASVGNKQKEKSIYALSLTPVEKMRVTDLIQRTTNDVACPFEKINYSSILSKSEKAASSKQFFYDMDGRDDNQRRRKGERGDRDDKRPRIQHIESDKCWFCLNSENVEKHLVITIGHKFYLALAKGPINDYHILIMSVKHIPNCAALTQEDWVELNEMKESLRKFYRSLGMAVCFTERHYKTSHLQINVIAIEENLEWKIKHSFEDKSEEYEIPFEPLDLITGPGILPEQGPYFVAELPDKSALITRKMKHFPLHLAREIFCNENLLNCDEKINWKDCKLSQEEETDLVSKFKRKWNAFEFS